MKYLLATVLLYSLAILDVSALPHARVLGVTPDLLLIFAACWAVVRGQSEAFVIVPLAGLIRDLTGSDPLGASVLALTPLVVLATLKEINAVESDFISALAVVAGGTLFFGTISMAVLVSTSEPVSLLPSLVRVVLPAILVNALFTPVVFLPFHWLNPTPQPDLPGFRRSVLL